MGRDPRTLVHETFRTTGSPADPTGTRAVHAEMQSFQAAADPRDARLDFDYPGESPSWASQFRSLRPSLGELTAASSNAARFELPLAQSDDGAEVVALLNNSAFFPLSDDAELDPTTPASTDANLHHTPAPRYTHAADLAADLAIHRHMEDTTAADLFGADALSPSEQETARQMRRSLALASPAASAQHRARRDFVPSPGALADVYSVPPGSALGGADGPQWLARWLEQWQDVLDRYADEVWGGGGEEAAARPWRDLTRVQEAREGVRAARAQVALGLPEDAQAIRRLAMVLRHLGGSGSEAGGLRAEEEEEEMVAGEPALFPCPDCGGLYGSMGHLGTHEAWEARRAPGTSRVEEEMRRVSSALQGNRVGMAAR